MKNKHKILTVLTGAFVLGVGLYLLVGHSSRSTSSLKPAEAYSFYSDPSDLPQKNLSGAMRKMGDLLEGLVSCSGIFCRGRSPWAGAVPIGPKEGAFGERTLQKKEDLSSYLIKLSSLANEIQVQDLFVQSYLKGISERSGKEWDKKIAVRAKAEERLFIKRSRKLAAKLTQLEKDINHFLPQSTIANHVGSVPRTDFPKGLPFTLKYRLRQLSKFLSSFEEASPVLGVLSYHSPDYGEPDLSEGENIVPAYLGGPAKGVVPEDLGALVPSEGEGEISQEILDKAEELGKRPIPLYEYVKNKFSYEPYFGMQKGALETLRQGAGNDADLSSLLIALYRASGWPARYVHGLAELNFCKAANWLGLKIPGPTTMYNFKDERRCDGMKDLVFQALSRAGIPFQPVVQGGKVVRVQVERVWVEVYVPYGNYRGAVLDNVGKSWIPLDPAMLGLDRYAVEPGPLDVLTDMAETGETITGAYLEAVTGPTPLEFYREKVSAFLASGHPDLEYDDTLAKRTLIPEPLGLLPNTLTFEQPKIFHEYAVLPEGLIHRVKLIFYQSSPSPSTGEGGGEGDILSEYILDLPEISGKRLTISYAGATPEDEAVINANGGLMTTPSYLVKVTLVLRLNGQPITPSPLVGEGRDEGAIGLGLTHKLEVEIISPRGSEHFTYSLLAGNYYGLGLGSGRTSFKDPDEFVQCPTGSSCSLSPGAGEGGGEGAISPTTISDSDSDGIGGRLLYQRVADYMNGLYQGEEEISASLNLRLIRPASPLALIGNELEVISSLGIPQSLEWKGVKIDVRSRPIAPVKITPSPSTGEGGGEGVKDFMLLSGFESSSLENKIFELGFGVEAVSAVKAIQLAHAQGMEVVKITKDNIDQVLPYLGVSDEVKEDITNKVNQGLEVTIPRDVVSYQDWLGTGYIAIDPQTKEASYLLQGNILGGMTVKAMLLWDPNISLPLSNPYTGPTSEKPVAKLEKYFGNGQIGTVGEEFNKPLQVIALDSDGKRVRNTEVTFSIEAGKGKLSGKDSSGTDVSNVESLITITGLDGVAQVRLISGEKTSENPIYITQNPGENPTKALLNMVGASASGNVRLITPFQEFGYPGPPVSLEKTIGDGAFCMVGVLCGPIWVETVDSHGNSVSNQELTFEVLPAENPPAGYRNAEIFVPEECGYSTPLLGQCGGSAPIARKTTYEGNGVHTIMGNADNIIYRFRASAPGLGSVEFEQMTQDIPGWGKLTIGLSSPIDINGNQITAVQVGHKIIEPVRAKVLSIVAEDKNGDGVPDGTFQVSPVTDGEIHFESAWQFTEVENMGHLGEGEYGFRVRVGDAPGVYSMLVRGCDGQGHCSQEVALFSIYGVKINVEVSPNYLFLDKNGYSLQDLAITYKILPSDYTARIAQIELWEEDALTRDGNVILSSPGSPRDTDIIIYNKGSYFDIHDFYNDYYIQVVLNQDSEYDVRSEEKRINFNKILLKSVDFLGMGNHILRKQNIYWTMDTFRDDGDTFIDYPEWQDNDMDGIAEKSDPVCYTKKFIPKMNIVLGFSKTIVTPLEGNLIAKKDDEIIVANDVTLYGNELEINDIYWTKELPDYLKSNDYILIWSISFDGGKTFGTFDSMIDRFFIVYDTPIQENSFHGNNFLTCKRIGKILDVVSPEDYIDNISSKIQYWRDNNMVIGKTINDQDYNGSSYWALIDKTEKGYCAEGSILMEQAMRLLGINAEYQHVMPADSLPVKVSTAGYEAPQTIRFHIEDNSWETLLLWFESLGFHGWNRGEGCCNVNSKLFAAFTKDRIIGFTGGIVDGIIAESAAHHILLQLEMEQLNMGNYKLQRWRKGICPNCYGACSYGDYVPVPSR